MQRSHIIASITVIAIALASLQYWNAQRPLPAETTLPPLARDLPKDVKAADHAFKERIAQRFPPGAPSAEVAKKLAAEGFQVSAANGWHSATVRRHTFVCEIIWWVRWREAAERVAEEHAGYGLRCP